MKKKIILTLFAATLYLAGNAQEKFGNTLNLSAGIGYHPHASHPFIALNANYEFDVVNNFTLAPSIGVYSYSDNYYWGNKNYPYRYYSYHETVIPVGVKGTYYFDKLFKANPKWDFYAAGTAGFQIIQARWEDGYYGDRNYYRSGYQGVLPLFIDLHVGSEYHLNNKVGLFLDLSTGISTFGIAIH